MPQPKLTGEEFLFNCPCSWTCKAKTEKHKNKLVQLHKRKCSQAKKADDEGMFEECYFTSNSARNITKTYTTVTEQGTSTFDSGFTMKCYIR